MLYVCKYDVGIECVSMVGIRGGEIVDGEGCWES